MKKIFIVFIYSLYLFFILGFFFHTSSHPQLFGKYTYKYALILVLLVIAIVPLIYSLLYLSRPTTFKFKKRKIKLTPSRKIVVLFAIIIFVILPIELYLRGRYKTFETNDYNYTLNNFHPFLQFQLSPHQNLHVNSYNFRADEISVHKPASTYRIFILGGSTVLNSGIPYDRLFSTLFQQKLQKQYPHKKIEVINAGNDGYTTEHSLIQYLFKIKDFDPDLIIMWHGINDWYFSCSNDPLSRSSFRADYSHFLGADAQLANSYFKPQPILSFHLITADFFKKFIEDNLYSDLTNKIKYRDPDIYNSKTTALQYDMKELPSLPVYERNLQTFINQLQSDHVSLLLGNQAVLYDFHISSPAKAKIYFPKLHCSVNGKYPSFESVTKAMNIFNSSTREIAEKNDIPFIDLNSSIPKTTEYFTDDVHYTERGNYLISYLLYKYFISRNLINL